MEWIIRMKTYHQKKVYESNKFYVRYNYNNQLR